MTPLNKFLARKAILPSAPATKIFPPSGRKRTVRSRTESPTWAKSKRIHPSSESTRKALHCDRSARYAWRPFW
jgi:hypothetical protein